MAVSRRNVDDDMLGVGEPVIGKAIQDPNDMELIKAYRYYVYYHDSKPVGQKNWEPREWITQYLQKLNKPVEFIDAFKKVPDSNIQPVWCAISRMHNRGTILPKQTLDRLNARLETLVNQVKEPKVIYLDQVRPKKTVQDHIMANAADMIAEVEEIIDQLIQTNKKPDFKMYQFLTEKKTNNRISKIVGEHFKPQHQELVDAYNGVEDAKEGYSHLTRAQIKLQVEFFADLIDDCEKFGENRVSARKPRKQKTKSASVLVKSVKFQKECVDLKLVSIDPAKIVGAQSLFTYNTKTSAVTAFYAEGPGGFTVKGTTVYGFNANTSITKKAGRALNVLPEIVNGGKVTLRRVLDGIKSKAVPAVGRIGSDTILLRVV